MDKIIKFLLFLVLSMSAFTLHAQDANKVYSEGTALLAQAKSAKTKAARDANCDDAIKRFKAAAIINTNLKKKCNTQIAAATRLKKSPFNGGGGGTPTPAPAPKQKLLLGKSEIKVNHLAIKSDTVSVESSSDDWNAFVDKESEAWCTVKKSKDGKSFTVQCKPNTDTNKRTVSLYVTSGSLRKEIKVEQAGLPVELFVTLADSKARKIGKKLTSAVGIESVVEKTTQVELKKKGSSVGLSVYCNSEKKYSNNENCNWYVMSKPDWCSIIMDTKTNDKNCEEEFKKKQNVQVRDFKLVVQKIEDTKSDDYKMGRKGELVLRSQDTILKIVVYQNK